MKPMDEKREAAESIIRILLKDFMNPTDGEIEDVAKFLATRDTVIRAEAEAKADALRTVGAWLRRWADETLGSYALAADALYRMAEEALRQESKP